MKIFPEILQPLGLFLLGLSAFILVSALLMEGEIRSNIFSLSIKFPGTPPVDLVDGGRPLIFDYSYIGDDDNYETLSADGIFAERFRCNSRLHKHPGRLSIKTPFRARTNTFYLIELRGFDYEAGMPIDLVWNGYLYSTADLPTRSGSQVLSSSPHLELSHSIGSDNRLELLVDGIEPYCLYFKIDAFIRQPKGSGNFEINEFAADFAKYK